MEFLYFKEGDSVDQFGQVHRVEIVDSLGYLLRKTDGTSIELEDGVDVDAARAAAEAEGAVFKFKEAGFSDWWKSLADDTKKTYLENAPQEGTFVDNFGNVCSLETGEVIPKGDAGSGEVA